MFSESDFPRWLLDRSQLWIETPDGMTAWQVTAARLKGERLIFGVSGLPDRNAVEAARNMALYLPEEEARQAIHDPDYFFNSDLIDCTLIDDRQHGHLGQVRDVFEMPGNNLLEVVTQTGDVVLIPFTRPIIHTISLENRVIHADLPEGLIESQQE